MKPCPAYEAAALLEEISQAPPEACDESFDGTLGSLPERAAMQLTQTSRRLVAFLEIFDVGRTVVDGALIRDAAQLQSMEAAWHGELAGSQQP